MAYELICVKGPLKGRRWAVTSTGLKVGRAAECEVTVDEVSAELYHCVVEVIEGVPCVNNLASDNGVEVNGAFMPGAQLGPSDSFRVGSNAFIVSAVNAPTKKRSGLLTVLPWLLVLCLGGFIAYQQLAPKAEPVGHGSSQQTSVAPKPELPKSEVAVADEAAYIQCLHAAYADGSVSDKERAEVEDKRKTTRVNPARAVELEQLVQSLYKKESPDAKYFDSLVELAKQGKTIEAEQAALEKLRNELKLSRERVAELETLFKQGGVPAVKGETIPTGPKFMVTMYHLKDPRPRSIEQAYLWARVRGDLARTAQTSRTPFLDFNGGPSLHNDRCFPIHSSYPSHSPCFLLRAAATIEAPEASTWTIACAAGDAARYRIMSKDGKRVIAQREVGNTVQTPDLLVVKFPAKGIYVLQVDHANYGSGSAIHLLSRCGETMSYDATKFFHIGTPESGLLLAEDACGELEELTDLIELQPVASEDIAACFGTGDLSLLEVPNGLREAEGDVTKLMTDAFAALKTGKKSREEVAEVARQKANEYAGFSTSDAAHRFLLYKGAFKLLVHAGPRLNDDAVEAWRRVQHALPRDLDPRWTVAIISSALKTVKNYEGDERLRKVLAEAEELKPFAETAARLRKRELDSLSAVEARELAEAEAALEHWTAAIKVFKKTSIAGKVEYRTEETVSQEDLYWQRTVTKGKTGKVRFSPKERVAIGDFWWNYKAASPALQRACRKHAADWYVQAVLAGDPVDKAALADRIAEARKDMKFRRPVVKENCQAIVVDVSGGPDAVAYPVTFADAMPDVKSDKYKSGKIVLKIVRPDNKAAEEKKRNHLARPFFLGIYEMTGDQYANVMGKDPSSNKLVPGHPVECVTYEDIRGRVRGCIVPVCSDVDGESFVGKLRLRSKIGFDLPDEWQWEYACAAGSTGTWGMPANNSLEVFEKMAWFGDGGNPNNGKGNAESVSHSVGTKMSNSWGFYDMHGNVAEWCVGLRDLTLTYRAVRDGSFAVDPAGLGYSIRHGTNVLTKNNKMGFRISYSLDW